MQPAVDKYEVRTSVSLGRYMVAGASGLRAGELILTERALTVGPSPGSPLLCFRCHAPLVHRLACCAGCGRAPVCTGKACDAMAEGGVDWHGADECSLLRAAPVTPGELFHHAAAALLPLRCLLLRRTRPRDYAAIAAMESHADKRRGTDIWRFYEPVAELLTRIGATTKDDDPELVQRVCGVLDVNSFEVRGPTPSSPPLRAVFALASLMAHDCVGNTHLAVSPDYALTLRAAESLEPGSAVLYNYTDPLLGTAPRRERLRTGKYFDCNCARCTDPIELGSHASSLSCRQCRAPVPPPPSGAWRCRCGSEIEDEEACELVQRWTDRVDSISGDDEEALAGALRGAESELSPGHYLVLGILQALAGVRRARIQREPHPSTHLLRTHLHTCERLIDSLDKLQPDISRTRAIAQHESQSTRVLLARRLLDSREISKDQCREEMTTAEKELKAAIRALVLEPRDTPEGALCALALGQLRDLRTAIADITM